MFLLGSSHQALTFFYLCTPCQAQGSGSTPRSCQRRDTCRRAEVLDVPWSNAAMQARKAAVRFIPPRGLGWLCLPSGYSRGGAAPCRASPDLPWQGLAAGVFRSQSQHACAEHSVPHFYTCPEKEKKADVLETQTFFAPQLVLAVKYLKMRFIQSQYCVPMSGGAPCKWLGVGWPLVLGGCATSLRDTCCPHRGACTAGNAEPRSSGCPAQPKISPGSIEQKLGNR